MLNKTNWIDNDPVLEPDIKVAKDIWDQEIVFLKGHRVCSSADVFSDNIVVTPEILKSQCGNMDVLCVSTMTQKHNVQNCLTDAECNAIMEMENHFMCTPKQEQ